MSTNACVFFPMPTKPRVLSPEVASDVNKPTSGVSGRPVAMTMAKFGKKTRWRGRNTDVWCEHGLNPENRGVYVWVLGQADVSWVDKPGGRKTNFDYDIYMKELVTLWGKEPGTRKEGERLILPAGGHDYTFEFKLPINLPSSFEAQDVCKGRVHYMLRARLDSPEETIRENRDKTFLVLSVLDLNKEPKAGEAIQLRKDKYLCCCCCKSGPVSCVLRLDRTGYVPGEDINLDAEIQNLSRKEITASYVTMQQIVQFYAQGNNKSATTDIFRISGGKIKAGDNALYHDIIHIPPLPPSRLDGCRLVDIDYVITVGVLPSGMNTSVEVSVAVIIGTLPLAHILPPGMQGFSGDRWELWENKPCPSTVSPSFSRYSHSSGEIEDYDAEDYNRGKIQHVYTYYKTLYKRAESLEMASSDVT